MTKDKIHFRQSMKHAHGASAVEDSVGISELCTVHSRGARMEDERSLRLTGLMKWSFDDLIVQEVWQDGAINQMHGKAREKEGKDNISTTFLLRIVSEGVPDNAIASCIQRKCFSHGASLQFLTPLEFVSSQERFLLVHSPSHACKRSFHREQKIHLAEGVLFVGKAVDIILDDSDNDVDDAGPPTLPVHLLPNLRFSVVLRGLRGALVDVLPRLEGLQKNGFLNYSHLARHGVGLSRAFESGRQLLHRDYVEFLRGYVRSLTESSPLLGKELPTLLEIIGNPKSTRKDWSHVRHGLEYALKQDDSLIRQSQTGLYYPHHALLRDFIMRASDIAHKHHDSAQVIRESIPRLILQEKLRSVADVHFNALLSLRWQIYGNRVVVGDLVIPDVEKNPVDIFEAPADHINGEMTSLHHPEWLSFAGENRVKKLLDRVRVVQTPEEARQFSVDQVVLPVLGKNAECLLFPNGQIKEASERLARELQIEGLTSMRAAPPATYRPLVVHPVDFTFCVFDEERGWCWESSSGSSQGDNDNDKNTCIRPQLYEDHEGILRQPSPLYAAAGKNMIARSGIRGAERRSHFLRPARRSGMTCVVRMTLPRGSAVTSALREVFQFATLDPAAIFRILR